MPGATVTAVNQQTRLSWNAVTDGTGFYTFPNLPAGRYNVEAELQGFKKSLRQDVQLDAAGSVTLDFALETGTVSEAVTVTAESPQLQSDVALRKTIESKDIEQLSFSGRNPIGVVGLKPGVVGGSFNNYNFSDLGNGGFSINGSRTDENNITVDGATAIRTRSNGAIVGIQNVDAIQEVQVLTGDYMPEYGRVSGGQIRMVTKGGSNRFSGSGSYFLRDASLQANTWLRNHSSNLPDREAAPFDYKQYAYSLGGPLMKDHLFFFVAQEWVNFNQVSTNPAEVPTAKMRSGDFSELLGPNAFYSSPQIIRDPTTGQPFPNNVIPANMLSKNGLALLSAFPLPTPGFQSGVNNALLTSANPQDQRKDNIRLDYRMNANNTFTFRYGKYNWTAVDAFRGTFPLRADRLGSPEPDADRQLDQHAPQQPGQRGELYALARSGVHQRIPERSLQAHHLRNHLPVHLPGLQGNPRQDPDHHHRQPERDRRRTVSVLVAGTDSHLLRRDDVGEEPSHRKDRHRRRVLGRGRLRPDQRAADPGQHQQPERPLPVHQHGGRRAHRRGDGRRRDRHLHQLRRNRPARPDALARDSRPTCSCRTRGGRRATSPSKAACAT